MPPRRPLQLLCALLIATLAVAPRAARGADSFYTDLLSRGSQAYSSGDYRDAERMFRIACFGFLDEPPLLLEGLVRLSLARAAAGDVEGFREAFGRISDLERRFGTYSATTLPDSLRQLFEQELLARIPSRDLEALELRTGASRSIGADMEGLPLRQRRAELRRRATSDPDDIRWPLALAELETEAGRHREALRWIDWLTELDPRSATGACLRGWNL